MEGVDESELQRVARNLIGDQSWVDFMPIGAEFGSPDYERLMRENDQRARAVLKSLVEVGMELVARQSHSPEIEFQNEAINVRLALQGLGQEVDLPVAETIWAHCSKNLFADWMSGAETVASARRTLLMHCWRTSSSMDGSASISPRP
jgi:hypothetical protein